MDLHALRLTARQIAADAPFHIPPPAQPIGSTVTLTITNAHSQPLIVFKDRTRDFTWQVLMTQTGEFYHAQIMLPMKPTVVYYQFQFPDGAILQEKRQLEGHNRPVYETYEEQDFQIAVYDPAAMPAEWTRGMIIYQIFPDSFARAKPTITVPDYGPYGNDLLLKGWDDLPENPAKGRDFYGGDLRGLQEKLPYLSDLGVECIYLCPIFASPTNHRYDAIDYLKIDPMLGTEEEFVALTEAAHQHNIKIVLDAVYNHCSCDSIYFDMPGWHNPKGAYQSAESPYYRWFNFSDYPEKFDAWADYRNMPEFVECPEVEDFFLGKDGVTAYWFARGVDGWRTDVTGCNTDTFWRRFRETVNENRPDAYLVSEEWGNASHYIVGDMFSATMNYRFTWALEGFFAVDRLSTSQFEDRLETLRRDTPPPALLSQMNLLSSHDTRRILTICQEDKQRLKQIIAFQMAYPGAPMIYYGDEAGLLGEFAEDGRRAFPWGNEDMEILDFYRTVIKARQALPALRHGEIETLLVEDSQRLYGFRRHLNEQVVYVLFNAGDSPAELTLALPHDLPITMWHDALNLNPSLRPTDHTLKVTLPARYMAWYHPQG